MSFGLSILLFLIPKYIFLTPKLNVHLDEMMVTNLYFFDSQRILTSWEWVRVFTLTFVFKYLFKHIFLTQYLLYDALVCAFTLTFKNLGSGDFLLNCNPEPLYGKCLSTPFYRRILIIQC